MPPLNAKIKAEVIYDDFEYSDWGALDLADPKIYTHFLISFGNGNFEEVRVTGETRGGVLVFANLAERVGFRRGKVSDSQNVRLYHEGDVCYSASGVIIFISPVAENGDAIDFDNYRSEVEILMESLKSKN